MLSKIGDYKGISVLELGPLEGGHAYMLEKAGVGSVLSIEANTRAFLKCLISKEIFGLNKCHFLLGDFTEYLNKLDEHIRFDLVFASGVLYHQCRQLKQPIKMSHKYNIKTNKST